MTYFFSNANQIVGVSLDNGLITSSVTKTFSSGAFALDMMRGTENCFGALTLRLNSITGVDETANNKLDGILFPNPAVNEIELKISAPVSNIEIIDFKGSLILKTIEKTIDISSLPNGIYLAKVITVNGGVFTSKFVKN
jgi:hypothetical protein